MHAASLSLAVPAAVAEAAAIPSFDQVYEDNFEFVWRTVRRLGVPERSVDDAVQDTFIVVHRKLGEFEGRASLRSWLFGIARRVAKDHRRRVQRKERTDELPDGGVADPRGRSPMEQAAHNEAVALLHELLAAMPEAKREVFVLAELEQMSAPEIADALDVKLNTVYSRLRTAREEFNKAVERRRAHGQRGSR